MNLYLALTLILAPLTLGKPCGSTLNITRLTLGNKEYAFINNRTDHETAIRYCSFLSEYGFPNSKLFQPTTEELNYVRFTLLNEGINNFWVGYKRSKDSISFEPIDYNIQDGYHGTEIYHWIPNEPSFDNCVYSTNKVISTKEEFIR